MTIESESQRKVCSIGLSQDTLKKYLDYNPNTGIFTWKLSTNGRTAVGSVAGSEDSKGYIKISLLGHRHGAHQFAWFYIHGVFTMIDHINNIPYDNRLINLRPATYSQNNHRKYTYNPTGFRGVRFRSGFYQAHIRINGVVTRIGSYETAEEAGRAYEQAAAEHYGEYANKTEIR